MSFRRDLRSGVRKLAQPLWNRLPARLREALRARLRRSPLLAAAVAPSSQEAQQFALAVQLAARTLAQCGSQRVLLPTDSARRDPGRPLRIGFFGNIANNAYGFVRCLRRLGHDVELVIEDGVFDAFPLARPFWEEMPIECGSYDEALQHEKGFIGEPWVRRVAFDERLQAKHQGRFDAVADVQALHKSAFGKDLPVDRALLLGQQMGHWPYLLAMSRYDVIQLSGAPVSLGMFCPRPYVAFPTGSDLFIAPFEESVFGLLMRAGYRGAQHIIPSGTNYPEYLERLAPTGKSTFLPLLIDTQTYSPGSGDGERQRWRRAVGGDRFLMNVCRQSWEWKGNDRLLRAFRRFADEAPNWRLVLQAWGTDLERSKRLVHELGLERKVLWQSLCSKPLLRERQRAADAVADQFVMEGYGTSVLESLSAGKPVLIATAEDNARRFLDGRPPPFIGARTEDEILAGLRRLRDDDFRERVGAASRAWVVDLHGYENLAEKYLAIYREVAGVRKGIENGQRVAA